MTDQIAKFQIGLDFENKHLNVFKKINSFQGVLNKRTREAMGLGRNIFRTSRSTRDIFKDNLSSLRDINGLEKKRLDVLKKQYEYVKKMGSRTLGGVGRGARFLGRGAAGIAKSGAFGITAIGAVTGTVFAGYKFANEALQRGSDLMETRSKFLDVFSNDGNKHEQALAKQQAKLFKERYKISEHTAKEFLSFQGDILKGVGITSNEEALKLSRELGGLALDIKSFKNIKNFEGCEAGSDGWSYWGI